LRPVVARRGTEAGGPESTRFVLEHPGVVLFTSSDRSPNPARSLFVSFDRARSGRMCSRAPVSWGHPIASHATGPDSHCVSTAGELSVLVWSSGSAGLRVRLALQRKVPVSTSSTGRRDRRPHAEPLLGAVGFEPLYLGEPQLRRETHRAGVGGLELPTGNPPLQMAATNERESVSNWRTADQHRPGLPG
jgi:hypothetical protein